MSIVKKKDKNVDEEEWKYVTYLVFDAPSHKGLYEDRVKYLHTVIDSTKYGTSLFFLTLLPEIPLTLL